MSPATRRPRKTLDDYLALPDDVRAELIDGELYMTPAPSGRHQRVAVRLVRLLEAHVESEPAGLVLMAPFDVHLPTGDVVEPDVLYLRGAGSEGVPDVLRGVPDLAIEILSRSRPERDRIVKRDLYARNGVPEFWIVDPEERSIEVLRHADGGFAPAGYYEGDTTLRSPSLPGLDLLLLEVFR